jgi:hypothetical protein
MKPSKPEAPQSCGETQQPAPAVSAAPIPLSREMIEKCVDWAKDDRLWSTQDTTLFNLQTFARLIISLSRAEAYHEYRTREGR